jgi:hypothetical protein
MLASNLALISAELPRKERVIADCGPMSLQNAADSHGHEMHSQQFVRLVGCHESNTGSHEDTRRLH